MIHRIRAIAQNAADLIVGLNALAVHFRRPPFRQRLRVHDPASDLERLDHDFEVVGMVIEFGINARRSHRVGTIKRDGASTLRAQQANMTAETMAEMTGAAVIVCHCHAEMKLDIGYRQAWISFEKAAALRNVGRDHAEALAPVTSSFPPQPTQAGER